MPCHWLKATLCVLTAQRFGTYGIKEGNVPPAKPIFQGAIPCITCQVRSLRTWQPRGFKQIRSIESLPAQKVPVYGQ